VDEAHDCVAYLRLVVFSGVDPSGSTARELVSKPS
jgi:hypothetical protein